MVRTVGALRCSQSPELSILRHRNLDSLNDVSPNDVSPSPQLPRPQPPLYVLPLSIKKAVFVSLWPACFTEDDALEAHPRSARVRISFLSKAE